jgi:hypothetical protein
VDWKFTFCHQGVVAHQAVRLTGTGRSFMIANIRIKGDTGKTI